MTRRVIKIYLASPTDLAEERRLLSDLLEQINKSIAGERDLFLELVSSEEPVPATLEVREAARIVNSDLFVLIMWKNWEEPDWASTEQKLRVAESAFEHNSRPRTMLYFRSVSPSMMADPGDQLQKVISFRSKVEEDKTHQFTLYDHPLQWRNIFHAHLTRWLETEGETTGELPNLQLQKLFPTSLTEALSLRLPDAWQSSFSPSQQRALMYATEALTLANQGKLTLAEENFSKSLELHENPKVLHSFGLFLHQVGSLDRAETIFKQLLSKSLSESDIEPIFQSLAFVSLGMVYVTRAAKNRPFALGSGLIGRLLLERFGTFDFNRDWLNLKDSFEDFASISSPQTLAYGLATAFRSRDTEPFGKMVSDLYQLSPWRPRLEVLQALVSSLGGTPRLVKLAKEMGEFSELRMFGSRHLNRGQLSNISPGTVHLLATQAEQTNSSTVDKISKVYSAYPGVIKHLGAKPLTIALSSMAEREAENPKKLFFMNQFIRNPETLNRFKSQARRGGRSLTKSMSSWLRLGAGITLTPPRGLYANSWFEDEKNNVVDPQSSLISGNLYKYLFGIERIRRIVFGRSDPFAEPLELRGEGRRRIQLEVVCPLLEMKSRRGVMRRTVNYYSGNGIRPCPFPIRPRSGGNYSLMIRVFYIRRLIYRATVPIRVINEDRDVPLMAVTENDLSSSNYLAMG